MTTTQNRLFVFWTEHTSAQDNEENIVSSEVSELKAGSWMISSDESPTHFFIRGIFPTFEEAYAAQQSFNNA
jgi:hypothetical protein